MKSTTAPSLAMIIMGLVACSPKVRVMQPIAIELPPDRAKGELGFPKVLCKEPDGAICSAAKNCAQLYNGNVGENVACSKFSDRITAGESASILIFGVATGIGSTVGNERARQNYTAVGLSAAALTSALLAFDNFYNCRDRAVEEFSHAQQRLKHLETAAHLLQCAHGNKAHEKGDAGSPSAAGGARSGAGKPKGNDSESEEEDADFECGRMVCGAFRAKDSSELKERANAELLRCIAVGHPTAYGPIPARPSAQ